jgi:hypothetical protein
LCSVDFSLLTLSCEKSTEQPGQKIGKLEGLSLLGYLQTQKALQAGF